jgi:thiamine-monophosphate kinase
MTEDAFFARLFARLPAADSRWVVPTGDDCAALKHGDELLLVAVDQLVGGKHYFLEGPRETPPEAAGRKLLARNLSDIAAMGGVPTACLLAAAFGPGRDTGWLERFYDGIIKLATEYGVAMVGGDLASTPTDDVSSLTILGRVEPERVCRRSGAGPGDLLFATGSFGSSLETEHHLFFTPRLREGRWLAEHGFPTAMMDVSDGLLLDASRICRASRVSLCLDPDAVPRRTPATTQEQALGDGEDYELLVAVAAERAGDLLAAWPFDDVPITRIGEFAASQTPRITDPAGHSLGALGYDHLS